MLLAMFAGSFSTSMTLSIGSANLGTSTRSWENPLTKKITFCILSVQKPHFNVIIRFIQLFHSRDFAFVCEKAFSKNPTRVMIDFGFLRDGATYVPHLPTRGKASRDIPAEIVRGREPREEETNIACFILWMLSPILPPDRTLIELP